MGRIAIFMEAYQGVIPKDNSMLSVSFIKEILNSIDKDFTSNLFSYEGGSNKKIKDINTAIYIPKFKDNKDTLIVQGDIIFNISFYNDSMYYYLYNGALKIKEFRYKDYIFKVKRIAVKIEEIIKEEGVIFKTLSPIIIKNKEGQYLDIDSPEYVENLNYICDLTLKSIRGYGLLKPLQFTVLNLKKKVLKEKLRNFNEREYYYINAYTGTFFLKGSIEDLRALYKTGIGYRRTQNAGLVEILK